MVSSGRVPRLRSSAVLFFRVSPATTREDGDGETRGGERERLHITGEDGETRSLNRRVSDAKEKFTKQLLFGSAGVTTEEETGLIGLLCYCVSLNKSEGC